MSKRYIAVGIFIIFGLTLFALGIFMIGESSLIPFEELLQLAGGRIDPQAQIDAGRVTWTGDGEFGDRAARNLRFTI